MGIEYTPESKNTELMNLIRQFGAWYDGVSV